MSTNENKTRPAAAELTPSGLHPLIASLYPLQSAAFISGSTRMDARTIASQLQSIGIPWLVALEWLKGRDLSDPGRILRYARNVLRSMKDIFANEKQQQSYFA